MTKEPKNDKKHPEYWIAGAVKKRGELHKKLHVPEGQKIPEKKLKEAEKSKGKLGQEARLANTLKHFKKK